jgi:CheY-like chemotaxis protein
MGIPKDMLGRIFDMFVQEPQALDRSKGGLGLGLAIVKSLVELHGGTVTAESEGVGRGSEFVVELPLAKGQELAEGPTRWRSSIVSPIEPPPAPHRILVVDDNDDTTETIAAVLSEVGYDVATAHDGPSALETALRFRPDICLLDIGLPVMDGYELARRLRELETLPRDVRLVAITGYGTEADRRRSEEAGFNTHLVKPVNLDVLMRVVAN